MLSGLSFVLLVPSDPSCSPAVTGLHGLPEALPCFSRSLSLKISCVSGLAWYLFFARLRLTQKCQPVLPLNYRSSGSSNILTEGSLEGLPGGRQLDFEHI
jgi:hypothetical protein